MEQFPHSVQCVVRSALGALAAAAIVIASRSGMALAVEPAPQVGKPIAVEELVADMVARNPELKFYEAEIAAARGGRVTAGAWANPELSGEIGNKNVTDFAGASGDGVVWAVSVAQTFEFPGRLSLRKAIANRQVALAEHQQQVKVAAHAGIAAAVGAEHTHRFQIGMGGGLPACPGAGLLKHRGGARPAQHRSS